MDNEYENEQTRADSKTKKEMAYHFPNANNMNLKKMEQYISRLNYLVNKTFANTNSEAATIFEEITQMNDDPIGQEDNVCREYNNFEKMANNSLNVAIDDGHKNRRRVSYLSCKS